LKSVARAIAAGVGLERLPAAKRATFCLATPAAGHAPVSCGAGDAADGLRLVR